MDLPDYARHLTGMRKLAVRFAPRLFNPYIDLSESYDEDTVDAFHHTTRHGADDADVREAVPALVAKTPTNGEEGTYKPRTPVPRPRFHHLEVALDEAA